MGMNTAVCDARHQDRGQDQYQAPSDQAPSDEDPDDQDPDDQDQGAAPAPPPTA